MDAKALYDELMIAKGLPDRWDSANLPASERDWWNDLAGRVFGETVRDTVPDGAVFTPTGEPFSVAQAVEAQNAPQGVVDQLVADVERCLGAVAFDAGNGDIPVPNAANKVQYAHQRIDQLDTACEAEAKLVRGEITKAVERASETMYEQDNAIRRSLGGEIEAIKERLEAIELDANTAPSVAPSMSVNKAGELVIKLPPHLGIDHELYGAVASLRSLLASKTGLEMSEIKWGGTEPPAKPEYRMDALGRPQPIGDEDPPSDLTNVTSWSFDPKDRDWCKPITRVTTETLDGQKCQRVQAQGAVTAQHLWTWYHEKVGGVAWDGKPLPKDVRGLDHDRVMAWEYAAQRCNEACRLDFVLPPGVGLRGIDPINND